MKTAQQLQPRRGNATAGFAPVDGKGLPASSMWLGITIPATSEDMAAILRTAIVFGRGLKMSVTVQLPGEGVIQIEAGDCMEQGSAERFLESVGNSIRKAVSRKGDLVLEVAINAASFLSPGEISLRIHASDSGTGRPVAAR
jgi:hypothetical protein